MDRTDVVAFSHFLLAAGFLKKNTKPFYVTDTGEVCLVSPDTLPVATDCDLARTSDLCLLPRQRQGRLSPLQQGHPRPHLHHGGRLRKRKHPRLLLENR